jgi:hypothetical protein
MGTIKGDLMCRPAKLLVRGTLIVAMASACDARAPAAESQSMPVLLAADAESIFFDATRLASLPQDRIADDPVTIRLATAEETFAGVRAVVEDEPGIVLLVDDPPALIAVDPSGLVTKLRAWREPNGDARLASGPTSSVVVSRRRGVLHRLSRDGSTADSALVAGTLVGVAPDGSILTLHSAARELPPGEMLPMDLLLTPPAAWAESSHARSIVLLRGYADRDPVLGGTPWDRRVRAAISSDGIVWISESGAADLITFDPQGRATLRIAWESHRHVLTESELQAVKEAARQRIERDTRIDDVQKAERLHELLSHTPLGPFPAIDDLHAGFATTVWVRARRPYPRDSIEHWMEIGSDGPIRSLELPGGSRVLAFGKRHVYLRGEMASTVYGYEIIADRPR